MHRIIKDRGRGIEINLRVKIAAPTLRYLSRCRMGSSYFCRVLLVAIGKTGVESSKLYPQRRSNRKTRGYPQKR